MVRSCLHIILPSSVYEDLMDIVRQSTMVLLLLEEFEEWGLGGATYFIKNNETRYIAEHNTATYWCIASACVDKPEKLVSLCD